MPKASLVRVLSVDDEETYRFIIREMLNDSGYEVVEAGSGLDGLRLTHDLVPDVILLDLRLTDMTGIEMCERLRKQPKTANVPTILVTSQTLSPEERERWGIDRSGAVESHADARGAPRRDPSSSSRTSGLRL